MSITTTEANNLIIDLLADETFNKDNLAESEARLREIINKLDIVDTKAQEFTRI